MTFRLDLSFGCRGSIARTRTRGRAGSPPPARPVAAAVEALEGRRLFDASILAADDADVQNRATDPLYANANFGGDQSLRVANGATDRYETFVKFDLTGVASVGSARVQLVGGAIDEGVVPNNVSIFAVGSTTWVEGNGAHPVPPATGLNLDDNPAGEVRWNNRPGSTSGAFDTAVVDLATVYEWDVTGYLQARRLAGATAVSFVFRSTGGVGESAFAATETGGGAGPLLIVEDDAVAPAATVAAGNISTSGGTTHAVTVTYADAAGVNTATIGNDDLAVTGPGGPLTVTGATFNASDPRSVVTTYTLAARGGSWDGGDNGTYNVAVQAGAVEDFAGNDAAGTGSFQVVVPIDTTPPVAAAFNTQPITSPGGSTYTFTVTYTDDTGVAVGTIGAADLTVARTGGAALAVTNVTTSGTGTTVNATYTVAAPGGSWDATENGTYAITLAAGAVADAAGNDVARATGSFQVNIPDVSTPTVTVAPTAPVTTAGLTTTQVTVTYSDNQAIAAASIDSTDVTVVQDGGGPLVVTLLSRSPATNAPSVVAVYSVGAPGGFWNSANNGTYTVTVTPGAVRDSSDNGTPLAQAQFEANVTSTNAVADPTFNGGSPVSTGFVAEAVTTDAVGRVLIAGRQGDRATGTSQSVLQRLNADGSLDTFWGEGGQVIGNPGDNDGFFAVAVDDRQRVVAAGFRAGEVQVVRYDAVGRLDRRFGERGILLADWGGTDDTIHAMTALPGGRMLVAGSSNGNLAFGRIDDRGRVDGSFGTGGSVLLKPGGQSGSIGAVAVSPDGSTVGAGTAGTFVVLVKLAGTGAPDPTFGSAGVLTVDGLAARTDLGGQDRTVGLAAGRDGRILVAGRTVGGDFGVRRLNADGTSDATFGGGDGLATIDMGGNDDADFVGLQGTGQVLLAGTTDAGADGAGPLGGTRRLATSVLRPDGSLESTFGAGGKFTADAGVVSDPGLSGPLTLHVNAAAQSDGRLLVTAGDALGRPTSSPVRRLIAPGSGVIGSFGVVNGRTVGLSFPAADGKRISLSLKGGGTGEALWDGGVLDLVLTGTTARSSLGIGAKGGNKRVTLRDVRADGPMRAISGKTTDVGGTLYVNGEAGKLSIGTLTGTLAAAAGIASLAVAGNVSGAFVLAGTALGTDARVGGTGTAADGYAAASIGTLAVGGTASATVVRAGVDLVNGTYGDTDDRAVGGPASVIRAVSVKRGVDANTVFVAGGFGTAAKIPQRVIPALDPHFRQLPG